MGSPLSARGVACRWVNTSRAGPLGRPSHSLKNRHNPKPPKFAPFSSSLFQGRCRSRLVQTITCLARVVGSIHLNPARVYLSQTVAGLWDRPSEQFAAAPVRANAAAKEPTHQNKFWPRREETAFQAHQRLAEAASWDGGWWGSEARLRGHHRRQECRRSVGWATLLSPQSQAQPRYHRAVAGPSDGRHSCRPCCMRASPPKQVLAPTGRNSFLSPPTTYSGCFMGRSTPSWPPSATGVSPVRRMGDTLVAPAA